jgi:hypothetical protein
MVRLSVPSSIAVILAALVLPFMHCSLATSRVGGDPRCPEAVIAEPCRDAGSVLPPLDHLIGLGLLPLGEGQRPAVTAANGTEQRAFGIWTKPAPSM